MSYSQSDSLDYANNSCVNPDNWVPDLRTTAHTLKDLNSNIVEKRILMNLISLESFFISCM